MKKIHFVGIGGIGMSALARFYFSNGWKVSGSDLAESDITKALASEGIEINIGHSEANLKNDTERVVFSAAVGSDNPELKKAEKLNIKASTYAETLAELTREYFTIAVSGSHGKGTTTAMLALIMIEAGLDPIVIIGTLLKEFGGSNFRSGGGKYLLIEADEYDRSFLNYRPSVVVITNVDAEHLDVFHDIDGVVGAFNQYVKNLDKDSTAILNKNDINSEKIALGYQGKIIYFDRGDWDLGVPGEFNQINAEAAWQVAKVIGVEKGIAKKALKGYIGAWRRMEEVGPISGYEGAIFYSDYGHHPTEIKATTKALKEKYSERKFLLVYQPHQAKRLEALFSDFIGAFDSVDELVLLPAYEVAGREGVKGKTSDDLARAIEEKNSKSGRVQGVHYLQSFEEALKLIGDQLVVFMGAGDIDKDVRKYFRSKLL